MVVLHWVEKIFNYVKQFYYTVEKKKHNTLWHSKLRQFGLLCFFFCWVYIQHFHRVTGYCIFSEIVRVWPLPVVIELLYHFAYFAQNTTLSNSQAKIESLFPKSALNGIKGHWNLYHNPIFKRPITIRK